METFKKVLSLEISSDTLAAMERLAKITGAESVAVLIQDSLRVFEWAVYHQAIGDTVLATVAKFPEGFKLPENAPDIDILGQLIEDGETEKAKLFFKAA